MTNFDLAKKNYDRGLWTDDMLSRLVANRKLTSAEYERITGKPYADTAQTV